MNYFIVDAFIQGEAMGRPSVIATRIQPDGNIFVGGTAAIVSEDFFKTI